MFQTCMNALAIYGRMVVIGMISQYSEGEGGSWKQATYPGLCEKLLWKSQTVVSHCLSVFSVVFSQTLSDYYIVDLVI